MNARKLSVFLVLLTVLSLFTTMTVSARSLGDSTAPFVSDVSRLADPLYIGITIIFPSGVPSPITGATLGGAWFTCSSSSANTLYCWGHDINDYPATLFIVSGSNSIPVTIFAPPANTQQNNKPKCKPDFCCGRDC
jgi:hypothetical protein